jgi:hypothetical protein
VAGISDKDIPLITIKTKGHDFTRRDIDAVFKAIGLTPQNVILASSDDSTSFFHLPALITSGFASRVYHHGIRFRENGTVVAGIPGLMRRYNSSIPWEERTVTVRGQDGKDYTVHLKLSKDEYKLYANGFRGVLVKADAVAIGDSAQLVGQDHAVNVNRINETGGIDLTPANMNVEVKKGIASSNDTNLTPNEAIGPFDTGIQFHLDPAMLEQLQNAPGFVPVIINIQPLKDISVFLEANHG